MCVCVCCVYVCVRVCVCVQVVTGPCEAYADIHVL